MTSNQLGICYNNKVVPSLTGDINVLDKQPAG